VPRHAPWSEIHRSRGWSPADETRIAALKARMERVADVTADLEQALNEAVREKLLDAATRDSVMAEVDRRWAEED
jgi:hypothetical protein